MTYKHHMKVLFREWIILLVPVQTSVYPKLMRTYPKLRRTYPKLWRQLPIGAQKFRVGAHKFRVGYLIFENFENKYVNFSLP